MAFPLDPEGGNLPSKYGLFSGSKEPLLDTEPPSLPARPQPRSPGPGEAVDFIRQTINEGSKTLDLSIFKLRELPAEIGEARQLQTLIIDYAGYSREPSPVLKRVGNKFITDRVDLPFGLSKLPVELGSLINLRELTLANHDLIELPAFVFQLDKIEVLNLNGNKISKLPPEIGQLHRLQVLNFTGNPIPSLPPEVATLKNLQSLYLPDNPELGVPSLENNAHRVLRAVWGVQTGPRVIRSLEFQPEFMQAGLNVLSYFSEFVAAKYKDTPVKVQIEREGSSLRLIVETPEGKREEVERTLQDFSLVMRGEKAPSEITDDKVQIFRLENQLDQIKTMLAMERRAFELEAGFKDQRIQDLEEGAQELRNQVATLLDRTERSEERLAQVATAMANKDPGDTYVISGQAAAAGRRAKATRSTLLQLPQGSDLPQLAEELQRLGEALLADAKGSGQAREATTILEAAEAAEEGNEAGVLAKVKGAGKWAVDKATDLGVEVAAAVISRGMGV